ncbi:MAG TPA: sigma-70 family RNA polymerase sigma factor [Candidatus Sulfotelmatobacter sp.]|nr:sigma-70 family RNA polymerase sigma factor [Candidatus Sulfotelmatobacter sp.]
MNSDVISEDAQLVQLGVKGDRDAFGRLVARYQSPVCALAYSACGNISQSEDLAQETFITAWRKLGDLREPEKFKFWLFGIARNLINNTARKQTRNPLAGASPLDEELTVPAPVPNPAGHAISKEEEEILWRSLENIPESYREPLVLFYREHQSIEQVAATLELSEEAARQRLSRGRKLLQEQVVAFVEGALARTNPSQAFTLAVTTSLPAVAVSTKAVTVGTTAAKGGAICKGAGFAGILISIVTPLLMVFGWWKWYRSVKKVVSPEERRIYKIYFFGIALSVVAMVFVVSFLQDHAGSLIKTNPLLFVGSYAGVILGYFVMVICFAGWFSRTIKKINEGKTAGENAAVVQAFPCWEYRSRFELLGLPFIHIRFGCPSRAGWKRPAVKAWIAVSDAFAFGVLFAYASVAIAPVSIGACAVGLLAYGAMGVGGVGIGGFAFGIWGFGAFAVGWQVFADTAIAWNAASGGQYAVAHDFAAAATASAIHANDALVIQVIKSNPFFRFVWTWLRPHFLWLVWAPVFPMTIAMLVGVLKGKGKQELDCQQTKA